MAVMLSCTVTVCIACMFLGDMLDELTAIVDGYNSYFSFSKVKSGYSGHTIFYVAFCYGCSD